MKNLISLQGRLGHDPELTEKQGQNGLFKVASFSLAVDRDYGDETDWFSCQIIGKQAEVFNTFVHKGDMIILDGSMISYRPKREPERKAWYVKVNRFWFCDKKNASTDGTGASTEEPAPDGFDNIDEDVPF